MDKLRHLIKSGVRSNELSILISIGVPIEDIEASIAENAVGLLDLIKSTNKSQIRQDNADFDLNSFNYPLIHPRYNTLNVFHQMSPNYFQIIQTHLNYLLMIPAGSVDQIDFISVCRISDSSQGLY